jgi:superfamily I DNA/RNA helicase
MAIEIDHALQRLVALGGTDEGFYVLALHAFIEGFCNALKPGFTLYAKFHEVIDYLLEILDAKGKLDSDARRALIRIAKEHDLANRVRHQFRSVTADEAVAATHNFLGFCRAFSLDQPAIQKLKATVVLWEKQIVPVEILQELERTRLALAEKEKAEESLQVKLTAFEALNSRLADISAKSDFYERELSAARETAAHRGEKIDELRGKLNAASRERDHILGELEQYRDIEDYLEYLERFTVYTRTRLDYERSVMRLSAEQEEAVSMVRERGDYIIKGGAGTGKTLVLLHALERHLKDQNHRLIREDEGETVLLTYTTTLVRYSRYLADIVGRHDTVPLIATADSFLLGLLKKAFPGASIDFKAPRNVIKDYNTTAFFSDEELAVEIEEVIWGNLVTREEYLDRHILRKGMRQPLNRPQREAVWAIQEKLRDAFTAAKRFSRNWAAFRTAEYLEQNPLPDSEKGVGRMYIDEAQDLPTALIHVLKKVSSKGIVLAADDGQSIYKLGAPYLRASLAVTGHVRTLRVNYRNTRQIQDFAERLIERNQAGAERRFSRANREGPSPEIVTARTEAELLDSLERYVLLATKRLGYDPENIGILAPTNAALGTIHDRLASRDMGSANIREDGFDFLEPGIIRLSTLHSSKGIEFPVVFLFIPKLPVSGEYDERSEEALQRNLLYVSVTRAMDYVVILTLTESDNPIIREMLS